MKDPKQETDLYMLRLDMSLGIGARTIHLGFWSPNGHRRWFYESYGEEGR